MAYVSVSFLESLRHLLNLCAEVMGRLDHLVEAVYDRFKDRYFQHERMCFLLFCTSQYLRRAGVIVDLHPKYLPIPCHLTNDLTTPFQVLCAR